MATAASAFRWGDRATLVVTKALLWVSLPFYVAIMLLLTLDAIARTGFSSPIAGATEASTVMLVMLVYGGLAYTQAQQKHVSITFLSDKLPARGQAAAKILTTSASMVLFGFITWQATLLFARSIAIGEASQAAAAIPIYPARALVVVGSIALCLRFFVEIVGAVIALQGQREIP